MITIRPGDLAKPHVWLRLVVCVTDDVDVERHSVQLALTTDGFVKLTGAPLAADDVIMRGEE